MTTRESQHYRVERTPVHRYSTGACWVMAQVFRKDSDEIVDQIRIADGDGVEDTEKALDRALDARLAALKKPIDWGRDPAMMALIRRYLAIRDELYGFHTRAAEASTEDLEGRAFEDREMESLKRDVAKLGEDQKVALTTPTPYERANPEDSGVLDTLTAKKRLFRLIDNPSNRVIVGYQAVDALLNPKDDPSS